MRLGVLSFQCCYDPIVAVAALVVSGVLASTVAAFWRCFLRARAVPLEMWFGTLDASRGQVTEFG